MEDQNIEQWNIELSTYSLSRERTIVITDDAWKIIEEVIYSLEEIFNLDTEEVDPKENLLLVFEELRTVDEIKKFIIDNLSYFGDFYDKNNKFVNKLNKKLQNLPINILKKLTYYFKSKWKNLEIVEKKLESTVQERITMFMVWSTFDQQDDWIVITNWFSEIVRNKDSKFIIIENIKTWELYIVAKLYDERINKITFSLHKQIFQYFLDKVWFWMNENFSSYDYVVKWWGYIQVMPDGTLYLHKESMDYWRADFELTKMLILEKFWINSDYNK